MIHGAKEGHKTQTVDMCCPHKGIYCFAAEIPGSKLDRTM